MRLLRIGPNSYELSTPKGAVLFSYQDPIAVRVGAEDYYRTDLFVSKASMAHIRRFVPADIEPEAVTPEVLMGYAREVLGA